MTAIDQARIRRERVRHEQHIADLEAALRSERGRLQSLHLRCTHPDRPAGPGANRRCPDCGGAAEKREESA